MVLSSSYGRYLRILHTVRWYDYDQVLLLILFLIGIRWHPLTLSRGLLSLLSTRNISFDIHREISTIHMTSFSYGYSPMSVFDPSIRCGIFFRHSSRDKYLIHDLFQVMDITILVRQLIDIRCEFRTQYMTSPSLDFPFWWISSSTAVVSLAPNAWPFPSHGYIHFGGSAHRHSSWV
jgi:hypothetical protein